MKPWIDEIKNGIVRIINQLKNTYGIGKLRLSFIGYRDWNDNNNNKGQKRIEKLEFTSIETFESFIKNIKCIGGGDAAEDVLGGIKETLSISWKAPIRVLYHICDAAPHGTMYHNYFERLEKQNKYINDEMSFLDGISDSDTDSNSEEKNDNDNDNEDIDLKGVNNNGGMVGRVVMDNDNEDIDLKGVNNNGGMVGRVVMDNDNEDI
eukprot:372117_1